MYIFAHLFTGILLGLGALHVTRDRRAFPVCIAGALLPDLLDKPLMLLVPGIFGSTRTIGHSLLFVMVLLLAGILLWYWSRTPLGIAFATAVLFHQVPDLMWTLPVTWFFPLHGMFPVITVSGNAWQFLLLELTNPSEWVFALASVILVTTGFLGSRNCCGAQCAPALQCRTDPLLYGIACLLGISGTFLIITGMNLVSLPFAASPGPDKTLVAGFVAVCGAFVFIKLPGMKRHAAR